MYIYVVTPTLHRCPAINHGRQYANNHMIDAYSQSVAELEKLSERPAFFGIVGDQLRASPKPLSVIVL